MFFFLFVLGLSFLSVSDLEISLEKRETSAELGLK